MLKIIAVIAFVVLFFCLSRVCHKKHCREKRRCQKIRLFSNGVTTQCNHITRRRHLMIPAANNFNRQFTHIWEPLMERFGCWYHPYTFDECLDPNCGHLQYVKGSPSQVKFYDPLEVAWRRLSYPHQFRDDEGLLMRAGLIPESVLPVIERINRAELLALTAQFKPRLNEPPPAERIRLKEISRRRGRWFQP